MFGNCLHVSRDLKHSCSEACGHNWKAMTSLNTVTLDAHRLYFLLADKEKVMDGINISGKLHNLLELAAEYLH